MIDFDKYVRIHIVDTETVGLKPFDHGGGVCEISVREVCPNTCNTTQELYGLINPEGPISPSASGVHGITDAKVANCPDLITWLIDNGDPWHQDQEPVIFVAYNAPFDFKFLKQYIECDVVVSDMLAVAKRVYTKEDYPELENHKMQTLRFFLRLDEEVSDEPFDAHSASGDTQTLVRLMKRIMKDTDMTLQELLIEGMRKEEITNMPFGKYAGKTFEEIKRLNKGYIPWCLANLDLTDDLREAMEKALES